MISTIYGRTCSMALPMIEATSRFESCAICGRSDWVVAYHGPVRDGTFGALRENAVVARCDGCGVERLAEAFCTPASFYYETDEYRRKLRQELDSESHSTPTMNCRSIR